MRRCGDAGKISWLSVGACIVTHHFNICITFVLFSVLLDTFVVWEMFPGNEQVLSDSGEEDEDYYFSDNDCT